MNTRTLKVRIRVVPNALPLTRRAAADNWQRVGRRHFINRLAYEARRGRRPRERVGSWLESLRRLVAGLMT